MVVSSIMKKIEYTRNHEPNPSNFQKKENMFFWLVVVGFATTLPEG